KREEGRKGPRPSVWAKVAVCTGKVGLGLATEVLSRSLEDFAKDKSPKASREVRLTLDLDSDEVGPDAECVYYLLLAKYISPNGVEQEDPMQLFYVSGIVVQRVKQGTTDVFERLGFFKWDIGRPASQGYQFGNRRTVRLI
ncbi:hypothetical protein QBC35DRAFT_556025, partial [Podospora australis]